MESIIEGIEKIYNLLEGKYKKDILEEAIMDRIVEIIWEYNMFSRNYLTDICSSLVKEIDYNTIRDILLAEIPGQAFKSPNLLPVAYEYIMQKSSKKKKYSIYYTPEWLIDYIVNKSFIFIKSSVDSIKNIKILEPSCGCGTFLIYIFDLLYELYKVRYKVSPKEAAKYILENTLYGVDIDEKAIKYCRYALLQKCLQETGEKYIDINMNLSTLDFTKDNDIDNIRFDLVIGNPPYLENRGINKYYNKAYLKVKYNTAVGRFDIYSIFIEKSVMLLKNNGILSFLLPGSLLSNNNFKVTRKFIIDNTCLYEITSLGDNIFRDVGMNMAIIILNKKQNIQNKHKVLCKNISLSNQKKTDLFSNNYKTVLQKYYNSLLNYVFDIDSSDLTFKIRENIYNSDYSHINDVCEVIAGIATGNIRNKLLTRENNEKTTRKVVEGKNVYNYYLQWTGLYIKDNKSLIDKEKGEYATFMRKEFIYNEKILIRQTADRFICAYDDQNYYLLNTLYSLIIREEYRNQVKLKYILALLNSKFYSFLYRSLIREKGKLFPQLKIFHVQYSPLIIPPKSVQNKFVKKVNYIISKYDKLNSEKNIKEKEIYRLQIDIEALRNSIDYMVYKLFNLSFKEIQEVEKEMGKSPIKNEKKTVIYPDIIKNELSLCKDIIQVADKFKINPNVIYEMI
jgi:type I restriction-modification system DNA methylase subunit